MADKQIYQLTETLSVSPDDWLAIDLDSSNLTRKARVGNVFSVSEGSSYTGGTADGVMFNDGGTFTTSTGLLYEEATTTLSVGGNGVGDGEILLRRSSSGTSIGSIYVNSSHVHVRENQGSGGILSTYDNQIALHWRRHGTNDNRVQINPISGVLFDATFQVNLRTDTIGQAINLSNGQTADAFQINSYGNTGGDLFRVDSDGDVTVSSGRIYGETSNQYVLLDSAVGSGFYYNSQNYIYHGGRFEVVAANVSSMSVRNSKSSFNTPLYIGGFDVTPDASSILEINSTTKGMLPPRMTTTERDAIPSPATGLSIFNTSTSQPEYYSGTAWEGAAGGGISIGDSIGGASVNQVLFTDVSGLLAQNSKFIFNGSTLNFTGGSSSNVTNSSFGVGAGNSNSGNSNTSIGHSANGNSTGSSLTSVGDASGVQAVSNESVYIGKQAGYQSNGNRGVFAGYTAGRQSNGVTCVGIGDSALYSVTGNQNTAIGAGSMSYGGGGQHVAVGYNSLASSSGSQNTAMGFYSGFNQTGSNILALGPYAGRNNTQSNRLIIGELNLPKFTGTTVADADAAAASALPASGANGIYLYWNAVDNTIKARP